MRHGWWWGSRVKDEAPAATTPVEWGSSLVGARLAAFAQTAAAVHLAQGMRVPDLRIEVGSARGAEGPAGSEAAA